VYFSKSSLQVYVIHILLSAILFGCMVGSDFHTPAAPMITSYTKTPEITKTVGMKKSGQAETAQYFIAGKDIPSKWWYLFRSRYINRLVRQGLKNSPNLSAAKSALRQAQENLYAQIGATMFPSVSIGIAGERQRFSSSTLGEENTPSQVFNLFNASINASYMLDIVGGLRRSIEASRAQVDFQKYELDAAYLTLTSNIVITVITIASLNEQIRATLALIKSQESTLAITEKQFRLGSASRNDLLSQQTQIAQLRATLPPLQQTLAQNKHALSILVGEFPSEDKLPIIELTQLKLPTQLPISVPSQLVRQRPDIQASEALLHVASANIGVATANLFPQITLSANDGWEGAVISQLINQRNRVWNIGSALTQPLFNGGALLAKKRAAVAAYQQAEAQYRQIILQALQNVADILRALEHDAKTVRAQKKAEISALNMLVITRKQYQLGSINYLNLLIAERTYQEICIARIQAEATRYTDTVALFQALGGGWWNHESLDSA
jgi:NodT family efflux transporter outer membrane factor (OMF) lipoprotein